MSPGHLSIMRHEIRLFAMFKKGVPGIVGFESTGRKLEMPFIDVDFCFLPPNVDPLHATHTPPVVMRLNIPGSARTLVASFLARAVADEIIPPSVLRNAAFLSLGGEVVKGARRLLSRLGACTSCQAQVLGFRVEGC